MTPSRSLDDVLEDIQVAQVDDCHIEAVQRQNFARGKGPIDGLDGWWMVSDERRGVFAYFATETEACAYRLFLVNAILNDIAKASLESDVGGVSS